MMSDRAFNSNWFDRIARSWRRWLSGLLAVIMAIALSGCSLEQYRTETSGSPPLVLSILSDPKTFNAALSQESPNIFGYTYEGLVAQDGITAEIIPALAESWQLSDDKLRIVFTLREGLKWSDGKPLTAKDVVFTYNDIYFNEKIPTPTRDILRIGQEGILPEVNQLDERRVEFIMPQPFSPLLRSLGAEILPEHVLRPTIEQTDSEGNPQFLSTWGTDTPPEELVVNGPYVLKRYIPSQRVVFRRNPYYWRKDDEGNEQPYIEEIILQIVDNENTALLQFRSGGLDSLGVSPQYFSLLKREQKRQNFTIYGGTPETKEPAPGTTFISFNLNQGKNPDGTPLIEPYKSRWFNTLKFRQAVAYALDRQTMINNIYRGLGDLQNSPISVQSPYYLSPEEGLKVYRHNLDKAKQLLLEAGFQYNDDGELIDGDGNRVRFTLITNAGNKTRESMGAQIKQDLSKIGIRVDFNPIAFNTLVNKLSNSLDWECHLIGFTGGVEPHNGMNVWAPDGRLHSFNQKRDEPPLIGREVSDWEREIHQLYIRGSRVFDEAKRKEIYGKAQQIVQEKLPFIYLVTPLSMSAVRDRVEGIEYSALGGAFWNIHELQLDSQDSRF